MDREGSLDERRNSQKNEESRVLIYNSILMAVRVEDIKSVYEKVDSYRKGKLKDEEADQTETD